MKLLFIDSNIFLDFYDFHDEDLDQLGKLVDLIKNEEIKLFLTTQVCNEIKKNRENRLHDAYQRFDNADPHIPMPEFCKHYPEYADIKTAQKLVQKIKTKLSKNLWDDVEKRKLKADFVIKSLIEQSVLIESDKYLDRAIKRHQLGKPPGKNDQNYGDELNWESLLAEVNEEGEFIIISGDSDFSSLLNDHSLKTFLIDEWKEVKNNEIYFYKTLTSFFTEHDIKIQLRIEQEKDELVKRLITSGSFLTTHNTISELGKYANFSEEQIKGLVVALLENNQVGGIIEDEDVNYFYKKHLADKFDIFDATEWEDLKKKIYGENNLEDVAEEFKVLEGKYPDQEE